MAAATRTIRVRFDGDSSGLTGASTRANAALEAMHRNAVRSSGGFQSFVSRAAMVAPVVGGMIAMMGSLTGVMGLLPGLVFAGGLAFAALKIGMSGFGDALKAIGDPAKFAEAIAKLTPAARAAAVAVAGLRPQFLALRSAVQEQLFRGVAEQITALGNQYLPMLKGQLVGVAASFNATALSFAGWLRMPSTMGMINRLLDGSRGFLSSLLASIQPVTDALMRIGVAGIPHLQRLGEVILNASLKFQAFIQKAQNTGALQGWVDKGVSVFKQLWDVIVNVGKAIGNIAAAFASSGFPSALQLISEALLKISQYIRDNATVMVPLISSIGLLVAAFKTFTLITGIITAIRNATVLWTAAQWLLNVAMAANPIGLVILAVMALIAVVVLIIANWDKVKIYWSIFWAWATALFQAAWIGLQIIISTVMMYIVTFLTTTWNNVLSFLSGIWNGIVSVASTVWGFITSVISTVVNAVVSFVRSAWNGAASFLSGLWSGIRSTASAVWNAITNAIRTVVNVVVNFVRSAWNGARATLSFIWNAIRSAATSVWNAIRNGISAAVRGVIAAVGWIAQLPGRVRAWFQQLYQGAVSIASNLVGWMRGLPGRLMSALGNLGRLLVGAGRDLVNGLWNGIKAGWDWLTGAVRGLASNLLSAAKGALGIHSPSRLFRDEIGRWIPEGMAVGITANTGSVRKAADDMSRVAMRAAQPVVAESRVIGPKRTPAMAIDDLARVLGESDTPDTYVTVTIDGREVRALVRTEIGESNRELRRKVGV